MILSATDAAKIQKTSFRDRKQLELQKMQTIQRNIENRARAGYGYFCYSSLISKAMAKTLIEQGYTLKWRGSCRTRARSCQIGNYKIYDTKDAKLLTLNDFNKKDEYSNVFIIWNEQTAKLPKNYCEKEVKSE